jgi:hypothetical protein
VTSEADILDRAIPNGVVNSFSTVIIRDMGFSTTMTTQLKSVGDAIQIVGLLIGGTIILNVPNCASSTPSPEQFITLTSSSSSDCRYCGQHDLYNRCWLHGLYPS